MLSEKRKTDLAALIRPGERVTAVLAQMRLARDPDYISACGFVLAQLDRVYAVPAGRHGSYYLDGDLTSGWHIIPGCWGPKGFLQQVGDLVKHPDPLPLQHAVQPSR